MNELWFEYIAMLRRIQNLVSPKYPHFLHLCNMIEMTWRRLMAMVFVFLTGTLPAQEAWNKYRTNQTVTLAECINFYEQMASSHASKTRLIQYGQSDGGKPIHLFLISPDGIFSREEIIRKGKTFVLINNGIHAGEPDGVNACIRLTYEVLNQNKRLPDNVVIGIIPWYNTDGALNTSCCFRAGQNGPETVGFRANARNLDLNRDFIKCDSENAKTFSRIYTEWDPDIFADTHVSNGADYQHVMTLIDSQRSKLNPHISRFMQSTLLPFLYDEMEKRGQPMCPYVNVFEGSPDKGMQGFLESPRYASGYSALFNAFPFVTETHMLKPFPQRVEATLLFMEILLEACGRYGKELLEARQKAKAATISQDVFPLTWVLDSAKVDSVSFRGYEAFYAKSEVTGLDQLYYDRNKPYSKKIPYLNTYIPGIQVQATAAYLIPQAWKEVIERLRWNGVQMQRLTKDTMIRAEVYYIRDFKTGKSPYEGHFLHTAVKVERDTQEILCMSGDYIIDTRQTAKRYLVETLEPQSTDAFFAWNFFDAILQQKEWYSDYEFDREAARILNDNPRLKEEFESLKKKDPGFASNSWTMLTWVFHHSQWYETSHNRYPVLRLFEMPDKDLEAVDN